MAIFQDPGETASARAVVDIRGNSLKLPRSLTNVWIY